MSYTQEITIATFCQEQECDKDIEVQATLYLPANRVEYTCSYCGVEQGQNSWLEAVAI
jgi:hypothetical protein